MCLFWMGADLLITLWRKALFHSLLWAVFGPASGWASCMTFVDPKLWTTNEFIIKFDFSLVLSVWVNAHSSVRSTVLGRIANSLTRRRKNVSSICIFMYVYFQRNRCFISHNVWNVFSWYFDNTLKHLNRKGKKIVLALPKKVFVSWKLLSDLL